jgi:hypothetical protein
MKMEQGKLPQITEGNIDEVVDYLLENSDQVRMMAQRQMMENFLRNREIVAHPGPGRSAWQARATAMKSLENMTEVLLEYGTDETEEEQSRQIPTHRGTTDAEPWERDTAPGEASSTTIVVEAPMELPDGCGPVERTPDLLDKGRKR